MTKGIVLFFEKGTPMWVQHVTYEANTMRGWVKDGHFWIDYSSETCDMHVCTPRLGSIAWDKPINSLHNIVVKRTIAVPATLEFTQHTDIIMWATKEMEE